VKISDTIANDIEVKLAKGILKPGERLPSERELAKQLKVSRPSIREAIQNLVAKNILKKQPGAGGGTYISSKMYESFTDPLLELLSTNPDSPQELLEIRHALEGTSAYFAALRAEEADKALIKQRFEELEAAHATKDAEAEAIADVNFHLSIAEASHNAMLVHIMRSLFTVLHKGIVVSFTSFYGGTGTRDRLPHEHKSIMDGILSGDPDVARTKMQSHIDSIKLHLSMHATDE